METYINSMGKDNMIIALDSLTENIKEYRQMDVKDGERLNYLLQQITGTLFFLETCRSQCHDLWQKKLNTLILDGNKVNRATNLAHVQIPELYMLRRILESAYECVGALRSNLSWLKSEKQNSR